ncbi:MlaD family protein [Aerosakkonemataceae cyanobacterium BLCC-F167]|uniref:MlaD family protein n=1 Tax=Floridaenema evergladense BLCC-F167 TaxID=3153639 RepID=A0ABV4WX25_9CYAN
MQGSGRGNMRSHSMREGSVGLLLLSGIGLFIWLILWLQGIYFGRRSYQFTVTFKNAGGMQIGTPVRYRGATVGRVLTVDPKVNYVDVLVEITKPDLIIPRDAKIQAQQSGLIGENSIDIIPNINLTANVKNTEPFEQNCNERQLIVCNNARLEGQTGASIDQFINAAVRFADLYADPQFYNNINLAITNTSRAAEGVASLTRDLSGLSQSVKQDLGNISNATLAIGRTVDKFGTTADKLSVTADRFNTTAGQIGRTAEQVSNQFGVTANRIGRTADQVTLTTNQLGSSFNQTAGKVNRTLDEFRSTTGQVNSLVSNLNGLITNNQGALIGTLNNLKETSDDLRVAVRKLSPAIDRVAQGKIIENLETLSANAAQASTNLRNVSNALSNPIVLLSLQQTLDSARVTFQNAQKITSDLDELLGDPKLRQNLRNLINGLSGLVSSTEQLQQQVEVAQFLQPMKAATNLSIPNSIGHSITDNLPTENKPNIATPETTVSRKDSKSYIQKSSHNAN